ncbi:MAG: hypothetical protein FJ279_29005, partial [Planctomycetes bacterium]|nr:hypothetical protein [Planctomycetota bacterium]
MRWIGVVLIALSAAAAFGQNLAPNGDFEAADATGKLPLGWRPQANQTEKGRAEWATDAAHSPTHALKLVAIEGQEHLNWQSDYFACEGPVEVSLRLKTEAVTPGPQNWHIASVSIRFADAEKKDIVRPGKTYAHFDVAHAEGTTAWTQFRERIPTPDRAKWARLAFSLSRGRGTAWLDDVEVRSVPKTGLEALADEEARRLALAAPAKLPPAKPGYRYAIEDFKLPATYARAEDYWRRVPPPDIHDGNFCRDGKPVFLVGTEGIHMVYPWLYRLLGFDFITLDACEEGSRVVKFDHDAKVITVGAEPHYPFLATQMRRLLEVGILPYISLAEGSPRYNPLREYFPELATGPVTHYYSWNYWHPDARRIKHNFARAMLGLTRPFPTLGYEMYNEIYYMSYDADSLSVFREAMRAKFNGDLGRANKLWGTSFVTWDAVQPPVRSAPWTSADVLPNGYSPELWAEWVKFTEARFERIVEDCRREMKRSVPDGRFFVQIPAELVRGYGAPGTHPPRLAKHQDLYGAEHGMSFIPQYEGAESPAEIREMLRGLLGRDVAMSAASQAGLPIVDGECPVGPGAKEPSADATLLDLAGKWKFAPGDAPGGEKPDLDDSGWKEIEVPGLWGRQGWPDATVGWYRKRVRLGDTPPKAFLCGSELADDARLWV